MNDNDAEEQAMDSFITSGANMMKAPVGDAKQDMIAHATANAARDAILSASMARLAGTAAPAPSPGKIWSYRGG